MEQFLRVPLKKLIYSLKLYVLDYWNSIMFVDVFIPDNNF